MLWASYVYDGHGVALVDRLEALLHQVDMQYILHAYGQYETEASTSLDFLCYEIP